MSIIDFIKNSRKQGLGDDQIVQEIIRQYPEKSGAINQAYKKQASSNQIIEEIIKQNMPLSPGTYATKSPPPIKTQGLQTEKSEEEKIEEAKKRVEALKAELSEEEEEKPAQSQEDFKAKTKEEILDEFLKRKVESEGIKEVELTEEGKLRSEKIIKPLPKRKGALKRFLLRFLIFSLILIILGLIVFFWYWYFLRPGSQAKCNSDLDCQEGYICSNLSCIQTPEKCFSDADCLKDYFCDQGNCKKPEFTGQISPSSLAVESTIVVEISSLEEIKNILFKKSQEWVDADTFKRIVFVNKTENKEVELKEFFDAISVKTPQDFFLKLENNFTFFVYSQIQGNRIGFIAKIKKYESFSKMLKSMESTSQNNLGLLFDTVNPGQIYPQNKIFKDSVTIKNYTGPNFRYKVLGGQDLGIYYLASDKNYFIFTTSWKSMEKVINKLGIAVINP